MFESPVPALVKINWQPMKAHWHWVGAVRAPQINHAGISSCVSWLPGYRAAWRTHSANEAWSPEALMRLKPWIYNEGSESHHTALEADQSENNSHQS